MLLVRTEVRPSAIHGLGLFAAEFIPAGKAVWRFTEGFDLEVDPAMLNPLGPVQRETLLHYGYLDKHTRRYVLCCDGARFINHSTQPNIASDRSQDRFGIDMALVDIAEGEEITIDYGEFE